MTKSTIASIVGKTALSGLKLIAKSGAVTIGVVGGIAVAGYAYEQTGKFINRRKAKAEGKTVEQADAEYNATRKAESEAATNSFKEAVKNASSVVRSSENTVKKSAAAADKAVDAARDAINKATAAATAKARQRGNEALNQVKDAAQSAAEDLANFAGDLAGKDDSAGAVADREVFDANAQGEIVEDVLNKSMAADKAAKAAKDAEAQEHAPVTETPKPDADVSAPSAISDAVEELSKGSDKEEKK